MAIAFIALGSNLQDPTQQIKRAFDAVAQLPETTLLKQSSLYKTAPRI
jgi:2-amino-4-hydroxy-6-hydroxymethyldihydropteridine diphosphokinase